MKVYTYFTQINCLNDPDLLTLWKTSWARHGWEPVVLVEADARAADPAMFARFEKNALMKSCPTNPQQYTYAAMIRWVAMTRIEEPSVHVDWDVMCNGYRPEQTVKPVPNVPVMLAGSTCPCAIFANGRGWRLFAAMLEAAPFFPRFDANALLKDSCDQYAASIQPDELRVIDPAFPCKAYNLDKGWETAPMIHFPNWSTPYPRSKTAKMIIK